jgi:hypothetical protein
MRRFRRRQRQVVRAGRISYSPNAPPAALPYGCGPSIISTSLLPSFFSFHAAVRPATPEPRIAISVWITCDGGGSAGGRAGSGLRRGRRNARRRNLLPALEGQAAASRGQPEAPAQSRKERRSISGSPGASPARIHARATGC